MTQRTKIIRTDEMFRFTPNPPLPKMATASKGTGSGDGKEQDTSQYSTLEVYTATTGEIKDTIIALMVLPYHSSLFGEERGAYHFRPDQRMHYRQSQRVIDTYIKKVLGEDAQRLPPNPIPAFSKIPEVAKRFGTIYQWYTPIGNVEKVVGILSTLEHLCAVQE